MLTLDLGNTRLKALAWRRSSAGLERVAEWSGGEVDLGAFAGWLATVGARTAVLSSVASAVRTEAVRSALAGAAVRCWVGPDCGLENRCQPPEEVGLDRLYAAAGAAERLGSSCLVVDVGTALTVDAVLVERGVRAFLGGAIAPGPALLAAALAEGTARLPRVQPEPGAHGLGRSTDEAIRAGIGIGLRGAARELVETLAAETGFADPPVVVTGGARAHLLRPRPFTARALHEVPELVHRGLLVALLGALEREEAGR